jgi:hypothetical protein
MNTKNTSREQSQIIPSSSEVYLRYKNEKDRKLFGFEEVSEYFSSKSYKYVIGVVNLETLYALKDQLQAMDVFIVNTGRKGIKCDKI